MKTMKRLLCTVSLLLIALIAWGQIPQHITVPSGRGWSAALRNAGLPATPANIQILQDHYGSPQPTTYVLPDEIMGAGTSASHTRQAPPAQSQIMYPKNQHVVGRGESFGSIAELYYRHTLGFVSGRYRPEKLAQYAATIAFENGYHNGQEYTSRQLQVGDTLWLPPANPLKLYDQEGYIVGYAHYTLLGDTQYGIENRWYNGAISFRHQNYAAVQDGQAVHEQPVGYLWMFSCTTPRIQAVIDSRMREDAFTGR